MCGSFCVLTESFLFLLCSMRFWRNRPCIYAVSGGGKGILQHSALFGYHRSKYPSVQEESIHKLQRLSIVVDGFFSLELVGVFLYQTFWRFSKVTRNPPQRVSVVCHHGDYWHKRRSAYGRVHSVCSIKDSPNNVLKELSYVATHRKKEERQSRVEIQQPHQFLRLRQISLEAINGGKKH